MFEFYQRVFCWINISILFFCFTQKAGLCNPPSLETILQQENRPTVLQIKELLQSWSPPSLRNWNEIPKDPNRPATNLQFNFPVWFEQIKQGAPRIIATFERAFPGATWAFIGRDMDVLADTFEAFYTSMGQDERVIRIRMSRPTLFKMTTSKALNLIESSGYQFSKSRYPLIFVDAISKGGGTQGKFLLGSIYLSKSLDQVKSSDLIWYYNMIGLRVSTTQIPHQDVTNPFPFLENLQAHLSQNLLDDFMSQFNFLSYNDGRKNNSFLGVNEAGYTHWTGAWNESYGELIENKQGKVLALKGDPCSELIRKAHLEFQAHVIQFAHSPGFRKAVDSQAQLLGYTFPSSRPEYVKDPKSKLSNELTQVDSFNQLLISLENFKSYSLSRVSFLGIKSEILETLHQVKVNHEAFNEDTIKRYQRLLISFNQKSSDFNFLSHELIPPFAPQVQTYFEEKYSKQTDSVQKIQDILSDQASFSFPILKRASIIKMVSGLVNELSAEQLVSLIQKNLFDIKFVRPLGSQIFNEIVQEISDLPEAFEAALIKNKDISIIKKILESPSEGLKKALRTLSKNQIEDLSKFKFNENWMQKYLPMVLAHDLLKSFVFSNLDSFPLEIDRILLILARFSNFIEINEWIEKNIDTIFNGSPTIQQINQIISYIPKNGHIHQTIATWAFHRITTIAQYDSLIKPNGPYKNMSYLEARKECKGRLLSGYPFWHPHRWAFRD